MDRILMILFLSMPFFPLIGFSQSNYSFEEQDPYYIAQQQDKFFISHVKIDINNVYFNKKNYIETKISPFFKIENFYLALSFPLQIDTQNDGIANAWTYIIPNNYLQFLQMASYQLPDNTFKLQIQSITDLSLGLGALMSHFRNDIFLPQIRELGFLVSGKWAYGGGTVFTSQVQNWGLGGVNIYALPLAFLPSYELFSGLRIDFSFIYDYDTQHQLWQDEHTINIHKSPFSESRHTIQTSILLPIYRSLDQNIQIETGLEYAAILNYQQNAIIASLLFSYKDIYHFQLGMGYLQNGFHLNFFSPMYLQPNFRKNRPYSDSQNSMGYQFSNSLSFFDKSLTFFLDIYGQSDELFSYIVGLELKPYLLAQLSLSAFVASEDSSNFTDLVLWENSRPNNFFIIQLGYRFADNTQLSVFFRKGVIAQESDNEKIESANEISLKVSMIF